MISANNVTLRIGKKALFEDVNIKFTEAVEVWIRPLDSVTGILCTL